MTRHAVAAALAYTVVTLWTPSVAFAWGHQGHETVGAIADELIKGTPAEQLVNTLVNKGETLSAMAVWADCVKHPNLNYCQGETDAHKKEWTAFLSQVGAANDTNYHFADVDITKAGYVYIQNQRDEDVVHGIREAIVALQSKKDPVRNPNNLEPRQGLWLLVHLVGDIHQPLHVGVLALNSDPKATLGSNWLFPNTSSCLHSDWDDAFVVNAMKKDGASTPAQYAQDLIKKHKDNAPSQTQGNMMEWSVSWATETMGVARDKALKDVKVGNVVEGTCGFGNHSGWAITLPAGYASMAEQVVEQQLWKAGSRLVKLLSSISTARP